MDYKFCDTMEVKRLDESIVFYLRNGEKPIAFTWLNIEEAKALYEKLAEEIPKAEESLEKLERLLSGGSV